MSKYIRLSWIVACCQTISSILTLGCRGCGKDDWSPPISMDGRNDWVGNRVTVETIEGTRSKTLKMLV